MERGVESMVVEACQQVLWYQGVIYLKYWPIMMWVYVVSIGTPYVDYKEECIFLSFSIRMAIIFTLELIMAKCMEQIQQDLKFRHVILY